jgi:N-acetylglucosamine-6-phosphate deacetylase
MTGSGFIDLQVNGYAGVNFTSPNLTLDQIHSTARALHRKGTIAFLSTIITAAWETYEHVLPLLAQAMAEEGRQSPLLGIHLEGPYISPQDGARGVHPLAFVRPPSCVEFKTLFHLSQGHIRLLTLAPELPGAIDLVHCARGLGVIVSIGHTLAGSREIQAAVAAGASASTHLGNGCPALIERHQNPLWPQLAHSALTALLITDGHHLPADFVRTVLAVKGASRTVVTSDAAPAAGLPPGEYEFFGAKTRLEPDGLLHSPQTGTLAGSAATMLQCMNWLAGLDMLDEAGLWSVGRDNALRLLGLGAGPIPGPIVWRGGRFHIEPRKD